MNAKIIGNLAESLSTKILIDKNFKILSRNFKSKVGEIDIICIKDKIISFVEVKSISRFKNNVIFEAKEQINRKKQSRIRFTANYFLTKYNLYDLYFKFGLMEINFWKNNKYSYNYIENIF